MVAHRPVDVVRSVFGTRLGEYWQCFFGARQRKTALLAFAMLLVGGCGGAALDATNADTFERTFEAMIAEMPEAEREALARAILAVHADARQERILPRSLPGKMDIDAVLDPGFRHAYAREIVRSSGAAIDGKTIAELLAMGEEIAAMADRNYAIWEQEQRGKQRASIRDQISALEDRLTELRQDVEAAEAAKAKAREEFREDLAILDGLEVSLDGQRPSLKGGWLRNEVDLTFTNDTNRIVRDAGFSYDWVYGECGGHSGQHGNMRIFKTPLKPKASASVVGHAGRGWLGGSIRDDSSNHRCTVATAAEYRVMNVKTSSVTFGDPLRTVSRPQIEYELGRLDARVDSRRERVASMQKRIEEQVSALAEL